MACVSITEAARLAGVSRNTLYKTYINKGVITISKDGSGKKCIDTSELLRVFGGLQGDVLNEQGVTEKSDNENQFLQEQVKALQQELQRSTDREEWYRNQIEGLNQTVKLLQAPMSSRPRWWEFWR